jgi:hypothetical protein
MSKCDHSTYQSLSQKEKKYSILTPTKNECMGKRRREREKCNIGTSIVNHTYEIAEKSPQQQFEDNTKTSAVRTL